MTVVKIIKFIKRGLRTMIYKNYKSRLSEYTRKRIDDIIYESETQKRLDIANQFAAECAKKPPIRKVCGAFASPEVEALWAN